MNRINLGVWAAAVLLAHPLCGSSLLVNVPEASAYTLAYELDIPSNGNFDASSIPYAVDNTASIGSFTRIAYYLELQSGDGPLQWVYASFNAPANITSASQTGVPTRASGELYDYANTTIANMNVFSNVQGIVTGTGISTGSIQFWPTDYTPANSFGVPNASDNSFDFGDTPVQDGAYYGAMQLANYGASQTLFAYNNFNQGGASDLGIGNDPGGGNWTFSGNAGNYSIATLDILVLSTPEPSTALMGGAAILLLLLICRRKCSAGNAGSC